ncbi:hypothetical protein [Dactylosporangium sp. NPDC000521]|uniref:hypothetical protein n=1 Tax=Dactylosporangium sp. NPDC000521 TaxID=3363975 RepID=UPI0036C1A9DB
MSGEQPAVAVNVVGAMGVQIGDHNTQHIQIQIGTENVPAASVVLSYSAVVDEVPAHRFHGREWLLGGIAGAISHGAGYVLVGAPAGMGKTALAARLAHDWDCVRHFVHPAVPGSREVRYALLSMAAQLVVKYDLSELLVNGLLPRRFGEPAWFPAVLAAAGAHAQRTATPVRIVIDGLDDAFGEELALGLPAALPDGVHIVATYRHGIAPRRLPDGAAVRTLHIEPDDPANRDDLHDYLSAALGVDAVAAHAALLERSRGVWIYVRYVLAALREGQDLDLADLPDGLARYYRRHVTGRRDDPGFHTTDLAVLATLAVAGQPMTVQQLAAINQLDAGVVQVLCDHRYRPFLAVHPAGPGRRSTYAIYHASLREYLHGTGEQSDPADAEHLRLAAREAHHRIAEHYLTAFGRLATDVRVLAADDHYALLHLPAHLLAAERPDDLLAVLLARQDGEPFGGAWAAACDRAGLLDHFVDAVRRLRRSTELDTDEQVAAGREAPQLTVESRCGLIAANTVTRSMAIPLPLLAALAHGGAWSIGRALTHARQQHEGMHRVQALTALADLATDAPIRTDIAREALDVALSIDEEKARADAISYVIPVLTTRDADRMLDAVEALGNEAARVLTTAAPHLSTDQSERALRLVLSTAWLEAKAEAVAALTNRLTPEATAAPIEAVLTEALDKPDLRALRALVPVLSAAQLDRVLAVARPVDTDPHNRIHLTATVAHHLTGEARELVIDEAYQLAVGIPNRWARTLALQNVVGLLSDRGRRHVCRWALEAVAGIWHPGAAVSALTAYAPWFAPDQLAQAVDVAGAIKAQPQRAEALAILVQHLDGGQLEQARSHAGNLADPADQALVMGAIANRLSGTAAAHAVRLAFEAAEKIAGHEQRAGMLARLAWRSNGEPIDGRAVQGALRAATTITDEPHMISALHDMLPWAGGEVRTRAIERSLHLVTESPYRYAAIGLCSVLLPHLDSARRLRLLRKIIDYDEWWDASPEAVTALAAHMSTSQLRRATVKARSLHHNDERLAALSQLAAGATGRDRTALCDIAVAAVAGGRTWNWAEVAQQLLPLLNREQRSTLLHGALASDEPPEQVRVVAALLPYLDGEAAEAGNELVRGLATADIDELALLAPHRPEPDRSRAIGQLLDATLSAGSPRASVLVPIIPHLSRPQIEQVLTALAGRGHVNTDCLVALAERPEPDVAGRVLDLVAGGRDYNPTKPLVAIAPHLPASALDRALDLMVALPIKDMAPVCVTLLRRLGAVADQLPRTGLLRLLRRTYTLPTRGLVIAAIGASSPATMLVAGRDAVTRQLDAILDL